MSTTTADLRPLTDDDLYAEYGDSSPMTKTQARRVTDQIKLQLQGLWEMVKMAYIGRAWVVLGYESWDAYCTAEFPTSRLRLPREERQEVVSSLRESGLSIPAIAAATGLGYGTVQREISSGYPNGQRDTEPVDVDVDEDALAEELITTTPTPVIGKDGKTYQRKPKPSEPTPDSEPAKQKPRRKPIADTALGLERELESIAGRINRFREDDRLARNAKSLSHMVHYLNVSTSACLQLNTDILELQNEHDGRSTFDMDTLQPGQSCRIRHRGRMYDILVVGGPSEDVPGVGDNAAA